LRLSHSITVQKLISESTQAPSEVFHENWALKPSRLLSGTEFDTRVQELVREGTSEPVFVESKSFELRRHAARPSELIMGRLTNLVKILSQPNASQSGFNTLQCVGVIPQEMPSQRIIIKRFAFVFRLPLADPKADLTISNIPISLKNAVLSNTEHRPTLGERFKLAYTLAETVLNLHSVDWLHKSIRSENILLPRKDSKIIYSTPYLVGFEFSRVESERSTTERDDILERDIYRHPDRQGQPEDRFMVLHDIYSLGVTLLEIGIWRPVLGFDKRFEGMTADEIKICLEKHAEDRLPHYMGRAYTAAVLHCLRGTLLEKSEHPSVNNASLDASQREQVQVSFLENVIGGIESGTKLS
jgi:serine/threonine protein kinase